MAKNSDRSPVNDETVKLLLKGLLQPADAGDETVGDMVGDFCLVERLGEGGFGVVWRATQAVPVRREVALKLLKLGMDSREVLARFEQERQMLATMEHPCIAGMLGAGMTGDGRPFFVMELVRGMTLTRYAVEKKLPLSPRLELFIDLCRGVHHAHQKGVIHRDLKPSNVLVTEVDGQPVPKIIDFGIAKALTPQRDAAMSLLTRTGTVMGTPLYMAPEQLADRDHVDTRIDVYALGALLYELLTDEPPFPAKTFTAKGEDEMRRIIREVVPQRPSRRKAQMLGGKFAADLDWITLRALEKDPRRRYSSAAELAADVEHYLRSEPVSAHPPEWSYLTGLWVRRNKAACAAISVSAAALLAGTSAALWQAGVARREKSSAEEHAALAQQAEARALSEAARAQASEKAAQIEKKRAEQTAAFMYQLLDHAAEEIEKGSNPEALANALAGSEAMLGAIKDDSVLQSDLLERVTRLYVTVGQWDRVFDTMRQHVGVLSVLHGPESEEAHDGLLDLLKREADHGERAAVPGKLEALQKRIEQAGKIGSKLWFEVQRERVRVWLKLDDGERGLAVSTQAMAEAEARKLQGQLLLNVRIAHVSALEFTGDFDGALRLLELCRQTALQEKAKPSAMEGIEKRLLYTLEARGDHAQGAEVLRTRLKRQQAQMPQASAKDQVGTLLQLARFESAAAQHDEAVRHAREALAISRSPSASDTSLAAKVGSILLRLAASESAAGRHDEAIQHAREGYMDAVDQGRREGILSAQEELAWVLHAAARLDDAFAIWEENARMHEEDPNFKSVFMPITEMAAIRISQKRPAEALTLVQDIWRRCISHPLGAKDGGEQGYISQLALKYWAELEKAAPGSAPPAELEAWKKSVELYRAQKSGKGRAQGDKGLTPNFRVRN